MDANDLEMLGTDLISRKAAIDIATFYETWPDPFPRLLDNLKALPSAQPRPKGKWIESDTDGFLCSVCRSGYRNQPTLMGKPMFEFCPLCGADMREEQDD